MKTSDDDVSAERLERVGALMEAWGDWTAEETTPEGVRRAALRIGLHMLEQMSEKVLAGRASDLAVQNRRARDAMLRTLGVVAGGGS